MKLFLSIALTCFAFTSVHAGHDPCGCTTPDRGDVPYRLSAKIETNYPKFHSRQKSITTETMRAWQDIYSVKMKRDVDKKAGRQKKTPEDSVYTLDCWIYEILDEVDCDYHLVVGTSDPNGQLGEAEISMENCDAKKKLYTEWKARSRALKKMYTKGVHVRIKGLGFFDGFHGAKKDIGTAWEIHPVKAITFVGNH